jgi:hypothetical protein
MGVVRHEFHPEIKASGFEQTQQRRDSRLAHVPLICRDHRGGYARKRCELRLAESTLDPSELEKGRSSGRRWLIHMCH